jgi:delta 1-pyrroline-5-carboxylate dehydrogenase
MRYKYEQRLQGINEMEPADFIDQTIATIRASTIDEIRTMAKGNSQETMTPEEVITIVDWVLREVSNDLEDALDKQAEQDSWWDGYDSEGFTEVFRGGMVGDRLLPRS